MYSVSLISQGPIEAQLLHEGTESHEDNGCRKQFDFEFLTHSLMEKENARYA